MNRGDLQKTFFGHRTKKLRNFSIVLLPIPQRIDSWCMDKENEADVFSTVIRVKRQEFENCMILTTLPRMCEIQLMPMTLLSSSKSSKKYKAGIVAAST